LTYTLSLHDALPIWIRKRHPWLSRNTGGNSRGRELRSVGIIEQNMLSIGIYADHIKNDLNSLSLGHQD